MVSLLPDLVKASTTCALGLIRTGEEGCSCRARQEQRLRMARCRVVRHLP